jgi:spermidine synthase
MRRSWLYGLFFLSGVSALVYELLWQRLLHLLFGVSTPAVGAVLAAFMGGLALGGLVFGRLADRTAFPLQLYAGLEAAVGVTALLVPAGFALLTAIYDPLYTWLQPGPWGGALLRLGLALLLLLGPATLIGGTLPVMARLAVHRAGALPAGFSLLYGVNTLGAVLGAGLTGFVFLRFLGVQATLGLAVALNLAVALGAGLAARGSRGAGLEPAREHGRLQTCPTTPGGAGGLATFPRWLALACAAVTGATTLGCEVVWSRILGVLTSNSAYAFSLMLSVMLLGLALGGLLQGWWSRRPGDGRARLALCQGLLAGVCSAVLPFFRTAPGWLERCAAGRSTGALFVGELALTAGLLLLPAVLMGMTYPLLAAGLTGSPRRFGSWLGRVAAVNTLGGAAGAVAAGFVLVPWLGIQGTLGVFVAGNLAVSAAAWLTAARPRFLARCVLGGAAVLALAVFWVGLPAPRYSKSAPGRWAGQLFYEEGNNATVSVVEDGGGERYLLVDGQPVAGTNRTVIIDQKMLAHLPLLLHPAPRRALTVGFGSGGTSHSMTRHGVAVDCVEIERAVTDAAPQFLSENHGVLTGPGFRLIVDDARSWLRVAPVRYDVITTDCTNIQYKSNADLYTVEYFHLMRERLADGGVAAAWVPANGIDPADLKTLLRSFQAVFPHTSVWFMNTLATDFLIVVGTPGPPDLDLGRLRERMAVPAVREDLEAVGLADPCRLLYTFLAADDDLAAYVGPGPLNTDDRPVLAYTTYGASFRPTAARNLSGLLLHRADVGKWVRDAAAETTELLRHYAASNEALMGHVAHHSGDEVGALAHYLNGARLLPQDAAFRELVATAYWHLDRPGRAK